MYLSLAMTPGAANRLEKVCPASRDGGAVIATGGGIESHWNG